jgi:multidrug efflux pump subunit AcrA (membrane-fusion protein)
MAEEALDRGRKWHEKRTADLDAARAELAKVVLERDAVRLRCDLRIAERDEALQQLTAARAEIERLTKALAEAVEQRENLLAEVERLRADLARETARRDDQIAQLEQRLGERETEATQYRVAASRAAEVLRTVEWSGVADGGDPGPEPGGCPCCGADKPGPHASTCTLDACLVGSPCADTAALWRVLALARGAIASDEGFTDADLGRTVAQAAEQLRALGHDPDDIWIEPSDAEPITPRGQP